MVPVTGASASSGHQIWYLDKDSHPVVGGHKVMTKSAHDDSPGDSVMIPLGGSSVWVADEATSVDVTFPGGGALWIAHFLTNVEGTGATLKDVGISIGYYDSGAFQSWAFSPEPTLWWEGHVLHIELQRDPATIGKGGYLAIRIENKYVEQGLIIYTDGCSFLKSPCNDPGYPVPELPTVALLGAGLLSLGGGYAVWRKRSRVAAS